jgi:DNA polymerase III epsilon subunit-like protein
MYLFLDTETAGLPRNWNAPATVLANWPRLVQIGWICCDAAGLELAADEYLIRPDGFVIPPDAVARHGITTARALAEGVDLSPVLHEFSKAVAGAKVLVGHNVNFDENVVGAELLRAGMQNVIPSKTRRCTMKESTNYCRIPGRQGYKWPTLTELHEKLFGQEFDKAHDAIADCRACMRCFFELKQLKAIP